MPTRTLLTGATGTLGDALLPRLRGDGHDVLAASRSPPTDDDNWQALDLAEGTGIAAAVEGVDVVVHAATAPRGDSEAVDVRGTGRLLEAAAESGVSNFLYVSIVGVDDVPFSYYQHKHEAERLVESSGVPSTIVRATQFHSFVGGLLDAVSRLPVWPLPAGFQAQPIAVDEVADAVLGHATPEAAGRVPPVGGPEVRTLGDLARAYRSARGFRRAVVGLPLPGKVASGFRAGHNTCPDRAVGTVTWEEWLETEYGEARVTR
jgi:uncharacterized protein YbjT (DUF2867 family)